VCTLGSTHRHLTGEREIEPGRSIVRQFRHEFYDVHRPEEGKMRKLLLVALGVLALPALAVGVEDCADCNLGIFAGPDINNTTNCGTIGVGAPTDVYLGIRLTPSETGVTGIEFSVAGGRALLIGTEALTPASVTLGSPPAPADERDEHRHGV
jgi:hypothetical protein